MKTKLKKREMINWLCLFGIISFLFYILHMTIGVLYYPGYNWLSQAVSDLTAADAPFRAIAGGLSGAYSLFGVTSCTLFCIFIQKRGNKVLRLGIYLFAIMNWISAVGYTLFPLSTSGYAGTFQDIIHTFVVTILVVLLSITSLILIAAGGFKNNKKYISLSICSIGCLTCMFIGSIGTGIVPEAYFGLMERFSVLSVTAFIAILGLYGFIFFDLIDNK